MVNWEKIKNSITKESPPSFFEITNGEYMEKWAGAIQVGWITKYSKCTDLGYSVYVSTCNALGKESILGGPKINCVGPNIPIDLKIYHIIKYNDNVKQYTLDCDGPGYISVIINCIRGNGAPKL